MNLVTLLIIILLLVAVVYLVIIERRLAEFARIQRAMTPSHVAKRLESEKLEAVLFDKFLQEDFSRSELSQQEQHEAFRKWKIINA